MEGKIYHGNGDITLDNETAGAVSEEQARHIEAGGNLDGPSQQPLSSSRNLLLLRQLILSTYPACY